MSTTALSRGAGSQYVSRSSSSGLYDVLDLLLDKGLVIDVFLRVSLVGIELLTVDARIVVASVDTYLRFAEAVNRLDLGSAQGEGLPQLMDDMTESGAESKTKGALEGAKEKIFGSDNGDDERSGSGTRRRSSASRSSGSSGPRSRSASSRGRSS
jgi:gas vesicle structural protein